MRNTTPALFLLLTTAFSPLSGQSAGIPENFQRENLVAWCIVPFDAKHRTPTERAAMLSRLGLKHVAYDWRERHVPEFESELEAYESEDIELFAFWKGHPEAFPLFKKHGITPQIWQTIPTGGGLTIDEKVQSTVDELLPKVEKAKEMGLEFGLYNHGGWGGLPNSMVRVCKAFHEMGHTHVGIVYNFHHSHPRVHRFRSDLNEMLPYLLCVNLNGMVDPVKHDVGKLENKIRPIGKGYLEKKMIKALIDSGYDGPIGILGHVNSRDVEEVLSENIAGLEKLLTEEHVSSE